MKRCVSTRDRATTGVARHLRREGRAGHRQEVRSLRWLQRIHRLAVQRRLRSIQDTGGGNRATARRITRCPRRTFRRPIFQALRRCNPSGREVRRNRAIRRRFRKEDTASRRDHRNLDMASQVRPWVRHRCSHRVNQDDSHPRRMGPLRCLLFLRCTKASALQ